MKTSAAAIVSGLGLIVLVSGSIALLQFGLLADEKGFSGWNPWLWVVTLAGIVLATYGAASLVAALSRRAPRQG